LFTDYREDGEKGKKGKGGRRKTTKGDFPFVI
jgi:hypothetical protein